MYPQQGQQFPPYGQPGQQPGVGQPMGYPGGYPSPQPPKRTGLIVGIIIAAVVVLAGIGVGIYFLVQNNQNSTNTATSSSAGATSGAGTSTSASGNSSSNGSSSADQAAANTVAQGYVSALNAKSESGLLQLICPADQTVAKQAFEAPDSDIAPNVQINVSVGSLTLGGDKGYFLLVGTVNGEPTTSNNSVHLAKVQGKWMVCSQ